ncbi:MAG: hypothetical protein JWN56_2275 [Sphingobacteriales bacterium]|nr:hypothetical protein [Sphingobacteriales bacterium]
MFKLHNPVTLFISTWLFVLLLYSMQYSFILTVLTASTVAYVALSCLSFGLSYLFVNVLINKKNVITTYFISDRVHKTLKLVFWLWLFLTCIEIAYFRSLPLLSLMGIGSGAYTEWGIPSLHGLLNAMIITIANYCIYLYLTRKDRKYLFLFLLCLCWPIMLVTRQVFMSMTVQAALIYIVLNKLKTKTILIVTFSALLVVYLFGLVGDLRSGNAESFINLAQPSPDYPSFLPSGFLWVYIYVTSPLNNVNFNISSFPSFNFNLAYILASIFPSFIRGKIFSSEAEFDFKLVYEYLNVSSMFPNYLGAFGYWGSILFYFILGTIFSLIYFKTKLKTVNIKWVFILVVILHNILFSVFVDFFSNLVFIFQILLHYLIGTKIILKNDKI